MDGRCRLIPRRGLERLAVCALFACVGGALAAAGANGQITALYDAGAGPIAWDPVRDWGWTPHFIGPIPGANHQGVPVVNDSGTGLNAWGIDDNSTSTANPFYSQCIDAPLATGACSIGPVSAAAKTYGWRFSAKARFVADYGTDAGLGLSLWLENRGYFVLFDLIGTNLRASVFNNSSTPTTVTLTSGGAGASAYHDFALVYLPATKRVAFEFDGVYTTFTAGLAQSHDNAMLWGNLWPNARGRMNFHEVAFQVLLPGDYNRDSVVDAADYTIWRDSLGTNRAAADGDESGGVNAADYAFWKSRFGTFGPLVLDFGVGVPEPSGLAAALGVLVSIVAFDRRRLRSPLYRTVRDNANLAA